MNIDKNTYYNYLAIKNNYFLPIKKFLNYDEIFEICKNYRYNDQYFPIPMFLSANNSNLKLINSGKIKIFFNNNYVDHLKIRSISGFNKNEIINLLFKNKKNHPYKDFILNSGNYLIETENISLNKNYIKKKNNLIGFATRNIPHLGHEKIILKFVRKKNVLINIMEDASNNKKINSKITFESYKKFIKQNNLKKKILLKRISVPSFLLGPRQAALHAIIARNLSCNSFIIGRDHSGYKNFYY